MKKIFLALGFCFQLFVAVAQSYEPGYVVQNDQDTIYGYVRNGLDSELANGVSFRINSHTAPEYFTPGEIQAFGFNNGKRFFSKAIAEIKFKTAKQVFAKNIIRGKVDLFIWNHPQRYKPDFFVLNNFSGEEVHLKTPEVKATGRNQRARLSEKEWKEDFQKVLEDTAAISQGLKYSEKNIKKKVLEYNQRFEEVFPVELYKVKSSFDFNILAGVSTRSNIEFNSYRAAIFLEKYNPERKNNFLITRGIVYHINRDLREIPIGLENGEFTFETQLINLIPIALQFQGDAKVIQPYGYIGVGAAVLWEKNLLVENSSEAGITRDTRIIPTINAGIGARIRNGSSAFIVELTPTLFGLFFNLGYSFLIE